MKTYLLLLLILSGFVADVQTTSAPRMQAKPGETVMVWAYPVRADKREQYEDFVHEILWPGAKKLSAMGQRVFRQTRVMHPQQANPDGTYTYARYLLDTYGTRNFRYPITMSRVDAVRDAEFLWRFHSPDEFDAVYPKISLL